MYIELTEDNLQQIVSENDKVMVQYGATWCGNCRIMKPKFKKLASENDEIPFYYVDAEKLPESRKLATVCTRTCTACQRSAPSSSTMPITGPG